MTGTAGNRRGSGPGPWAGTVQSEPRLHNFTTRNQNLVILNWKRKKQYTYNRLPIIANLGNGTSFGKRNQFWLTPRTEIIIILKLNKKKTVTYLHMQVGQLRDCLAVKSTARHPSEQ